jgi:hypothetical protein
LPEHENYNATARCVVLFRIKSRSKDSQRPFCGDQSLAVLKKVDLLSGAWVTKIKVDKPIRQNG